MAGWGEEAKVNTYGPFHGIPIKKLFQDIILENAEITPNEVHQRLEITANTFDFRRGGLTFEEMITKRWTQMFEWEELAKQWASGLYDLIMSPFQLPLTVPDLYAQERDDPKCEHEVVEMEPEAQLVATSDNPIPKTEIKSWLHEDSSGWSGQPNREGYALGRRFIVTDKNYFGLAPPDAEVGDVIACFFGCNVPFILRRLNDGRFKLIGEVHVQGILDGEAIPQ